LRLHRRFVQNEASGANAALRCRCLLGRNRAIGGVKLPGRAMSEHKGFPPIARRVVPLLLIALAVAGCSSKAERAQSYYQKGMQYLQQHDNQKAEIEFKNAVKLQEDLLPAWRGLAQIDEAAHQWQALAAALRKIVELDTKDLDAKLKLARLMLTGGAADQALKLANEMNDPGNAQVLALKAAIAYKLKDTGSAVRDAQAALKIDPTNLDAMMVLAADRLANSDASGALRIIDNDPRDHSKDLAVQVLKIRAYEQLGDAAKVETLLKQLIELHPEENGFRKQLVKFYVAQHRDSDAEKELRAVAKGEPNNTDAELDVVRFLAAVKGPAPARQELLARIGAGGDVFPYQLALAEFDYANNRVEDSTKLLESLANNKADPEHALTAKVKLAERAVARKDIAAADALVSDILSKDRRNIGALKLRALIHVNRNELEPAISDLREALNDSPRSTELMLLLASVYERIGSIELAEKEFADASRASNYNPGVGMAYVAFLRRRGSVQRAEDVLVDLANRNPRNVGVLSSLAEVKLAHRDWAGAQEIGDAIHKIGDHSGIADEILGIALGGQHKYDQSIAALQSAVAAAPSAVQPMVSLVGEWVQTKQTDKAIAFLQSVLKANPANAEALVLLGSISLANNAPDQAVKSFTMAIAKQPKDVVGYRALANLYLGQNNIEEAAKITRAGLKELPDSVDLHLLLASILEKTGDYEAAIAEYEYLLVQQPGSMLVANNLASVLSDHRTDKGSLDRAQSLAAMLRKSQVPQFKDTLGWVSYRAGDFKSAVPLLEEAAAAMPNVAVVHYHLGMSYRAAGQIGKAAEEFKTALTKSPDSSLAQSIEAELRKTATQ
jgi:cellulose synthase operon protein C